MIWPYKCQNKTTSLRTKDKTMALHSCLRAKIWTNGSSSTGATIKFCRQNTRLIATSLIDCDRLQWEMKWSWTVLVTGAIKRLKKKSNRPRNWIERPRKSLLKDQTEVEKLKKLTIMLMMPRKRLMSGRRSSRMGSFGKESHGYQSKWGKWPKKRRRC